MAGTVSHRGVYSIISALHRKAGPPLSQANIRRTEVPRRKRIQGQALNTHPDYALPHRSLTVAKLAMNFRNAGQSGTSYRSVRGPAVGLFFPLGLGAFFLFLCHKGSPPFVSIRVLRSLPRMQVIKKSSRALPSNRLAGDDEGALFNGIERSKSLLKDDDRLNNRKAG